MRAAPTLTNVTRPDCTLAVWDWAGSGPTLVFAHANGFHGRCWDAIIELLPTNYRCLALDLRGHGHSGDVAPPTSWRPFGEDIAAVMQALGVRDAIGIGHSLGGHALTIAAAHAPAAFTRLLLIDPTIFAERRYTGPREGEHFVSRRRAQWDSVEAMVDRFASREPYQEWEPRVLHDYCQYGLLPNPGGPGLVLACAPVFEGTVYQVSVAQESNPYPELAQLHQPTLVLRTGKVPYAPGAGFAASPTVPDLASHLAHARDEVDAGYSHFLPMESPARVVTALAAVQAADW